LAFEANSDAPVARDSHQFLEVFDFLVERSPVFATRNRQRNHFGGFRKIANFGEAFVVNVPLGYDFDAITADVQSMRVSHQTQAFVVFLDNSGGWHLAAIVVKDNFHAREFQIAQDLDHVREWDIRKTIS
jgi:hypothetical protein